MKIKFVVVLSDDEVTAIADTLATLNEIIKYTEKRDNSELNIVYATAKRAMDALKDFYKECYL